MRGVGLSKKRDDIIYLCRVRTSVRTIDITLQDTVHCKLIIKIITKTHQQNAIVTKTKNIQARDILLRIAKYINLLQPNGFVRQQV